MGDDGLGPAGESAFGWEVREKRLLGYRGLGERRAVWGFLGEEDRLPRSGRPGSRVWSRDFRIRVGESEKCDFVRRGIW